MKKTSKVSETSERAREHGLRRVERRHLTSPGEVKLKDVKVRVTMYLDADILEFFKNRAKSPNSAPYQTQINTELRSLIRKNRGEDRYSDLINNESFIKAVAEKVKRAI